jgi:Fic family protein
MGSAEDYLRRRAERYQPSGTRLLCSPEELTRRESENLRRLQSFVLDLVQITPDPNPFVRSVILEMHRLSVAGIYPSAGRFREMGERVIIPGSGFEPAPVYRIEAEISDLLTRVSRVVDRPARFDWRVNFASLVLHRFLRIHPFLDGNGRVGRAIHQLLLYKLGLLEPPEMIYDFFLAYRDEYLRALREADNGDVLPWFSLNRHAILDRHIQRWFDRWPDTPFLQDYVLSRLAADERFLLNRAHRLNLGFDESTTRLEALLIKLDLLLEELIEDAGDEAGR